jgi:hypothetical protein
MSLKKGALANRLKNSGTALPSEAARIDPDTASSSEGGFPEPLVRWGAKSANRHSNTFVSLLSIGRFFVLSVFGNIHRCKDFAEDKER